MWVWDVPHLPSDNEERTQEGGERIRPGHLTVDRVGDVGVVGGPMLMVFFGLAGTSIR